MHEKRQDISEHLYGRMMQLLPATSQSLTSSVTLGFCGWYLETLLPFAKYHVDLSQC